MKIFLRTPKGWSKPVNNKGKERCDIDGAKLWVGPSGQIYCDLEHDLNVVKFVLADGGYRSNVKDIAGKQRSKTVPI